MISNGNLIDSNDILIAGIMLSNGIIKIITRNVNHFEKIESLEIINYWFNYKTYSSNWMS